MSELKVTTVYDAYWKANSTGEGTGILVYLKSEADKVIAELEDKLRAANEQIENLINSASSIMLFQDRVKDNKCAELRHHKYKRCLDKAEMCKAKYDKEDAMVNGRGASWDYTSEEMKYWERWSKRWLEIAEKFKEVEK